MFSNLFVLAKEHVFSVLAFSIFGLMFAMRPVTWLPTVIILGCALTVVVNACFRRRLACLAVDQDFRWIFFSFATWFVGCLFVGLWHWGFSKNAFLENPFRILLALSTLALSVHVASKKAFVTGLLVASICVVLDVAYGYLIHDDYFPRISGTTNHPIHFGNFAALLAMLLMSLAMLASVYKSVFRMLFLVGFLLALGAGTASQARSSFVVLLCLIPLFFVLKTDQFHRWLIRMGYVFALSALLLVAALPSLQEKLRLSEAVSDIHMAESGNYQGSLGSRLAMWQSAWFIFKANPIVGIGPHKFQSEFIKQMQTGEVPRADAEHNQPHNDLLNAAATGGVIKLMAYVLLIAGPFVFFYKKYKAKKLDLSERIFPIMGMQVVGAFFLTGLTNSNFDLQIYSTTYAVLVCVLAKLSMQTDVA
jgi:O-antigen ligase